MNDIEQQKTNLLQHQSLTDSDRKTVIDWLHTQLENTHHKEEALQAGLASLQKERALYAESPLSLLQFWQTFEWLWEQFQSASEIGRLVFFRKFLGAVTVS